MERILIGRAVVAGSAEGTALVSSEPISFWGGVCPHTGEVIDRRHELSGQNVTGRVFVFPTGRGSSTSSATLMQSIKAGVAPAAIINLSVDPMLALGSIVSDELYHRTVPIVILSEEDFLSIKPNDHLVVEPDGKVLVNPK
ncbi:MAG: aconitase X swivel domain-containing protein [Planctomycetota bacterium]|jgi:predicted aconitase with swiveling domain